MAAWRQDFVRTLVGRLGALDPAAVNAVFAELSAAGAEQLTQEGISRSDAEFTFHADLRYLGQEHAIPVPVHGPELMTGDVSRLRAMFHDEHAKRYSQSAPDESMECVSVRLVVTAARRERERVVQQWMNEPWRAEAQFEESRRKIVFADPAHPVEARVLWRPSLEPAMVINGPAVIEEPNATTLLHPGDTATVSPAGHIIISIGQEK
ncbi:MAG TPA: hypothetical protein VFW28_02780 [Micropepsaceae bacterium]|nr:hypothetical protein [Micropepsaceae bacterium]